jgi:hypothetical protein
MISAIAKCYPTRYVATPEQYLEIVYLDGRCEHLRGPRDCRWSCGKHQNIAVKPLVRKVATATQYLLVQGRDGKTSVIRGPHEVVFDAFQHEKVEVKNLARHKADQNQYIEVQYMDGRKEHHRGPREFIADPFQHARVEVREGVKLAANEALVVYRKEAAPAAALVAKTEVLKPNGGGAKAPEHRGTPTLSAEFTGGGGAGVAHVQRRVVHGPAVFMLEADEWIHTFSWHGSIKNGKGSKTGYAGDEKVAPPIQWLCRHCGRALSPEALLFQVPHALEFQVLRCMCVRGFPNPSTRSYWAGKICLLLNPSTSETSEPEHHAVYRPDQMYYSVKDVRTSDDAHLTVHLMLFYELNNIETMLDSTNDLLGDFINAAAADVMTFASTNTYESFLAKTAELSELASFPILRSRMEQTGSALMKVVYRGYTTSQQLQSMHENAIVNRTKLRLAGDHGRDEQEKLAMELRCRQERSQQEQALARSEQEHKMGMVARQKEQERADADHAREQQTRYAQADALVQLEAKRGLHDEDLRHLRERMAIETEAAQKREEAERERYQAMKTMGVDLTKYLCSLNEARPDQHLRIDSGAAGAPALHLQLPHGK